MQEQLPPFLSSSETQHSEKKSPHFYWIAGALGTQQGGDKIRLQLEGQFNTNGEQNVTYLHSVASVDKVDTTDGPNNRYNKTAQEIIARLENSQETVIAVHSFGALELLKIIENLEKTPKFKEYAEKLTVILVAPFGVVENIASVFTLLRVVEVARSQAALGPLNSFRQGIESLNYLPPTTLNTPALELALTEVFKDQSHYAPLTGTTAPTFSSLTTPANFFSTLPEERQKAIKDKVAEVDRHIATCVEQKNWFILEKLLKERGGLLAVEMDEAYKGGVETPQQSPLEMYKTLAQAQLGINGIVSNIVHGETFKAIRKIKGYGSHVKAIIPEFDVVYTIDELKHLLEIESDEEVAEIIAILTATTHASFSFNAVGIAKAAKHLATQPATMTPVPPRS